MGFILMTLLVALALYPATTSAFRTHIPSHLNRGRALQCDSGGQEKYSNPVAAVLSNFIKKEDAEVEDEKVMDIDKIAWGKKKRRKTNLESLRKDLDKAVAKNSFFVTGIVSPELYSDDFAFSDPDVSVKGVEEYARGVAKIFKSGTKADLIRSEIVQPDVITVTWRLEGAVNIGPGLPIKAFVVYSDFSVGEDGLIYFQKDRFSLSGIDIILSAFFPFLIGRITAPPVPPVDQM